MALSLRRLNEDQNCTAASILSFPDYLSSKPPRYDLATVAAVSSLYIFLAIAIICDEYFVPAIELLCYKLELPYDVAGATFLAAATSCPELCVHCYATFLTEGDIGIGTIVGSSVFNTLAVPACASLFSGVVLNLDWWPLTRDVIWYTISVVVLSLIVADGFIRIHEAAILISLYFVYLIQVLNDRRIQGCVRNVDRECRLSCFVPRGSVPDLRASTITQPTYAGDEEETEEGYNLWHFPVYSTFGWQLWWIVIWPLHFLFFVTIPDVHKSHSGLKCGLTNIMCTMWISVLTFLISWTMTVLGHNFFIPDSVMGITFVAVGTSIPEAVACVIVTRKGYGSMSICNTVGSNIFDILICLGVPWTIMAVKLHMQETNLRLNSSGLIYVCLSLLSTVFVLYVSFMCSRFTMGLRVGITCLITYLIFLIFSCAMELNVFGEFNLPVCAVEW